MKTYSMLAALSLFASCNGADPDAARQGRNDTVINDGTRVDTADMIQVLPNDSDHFRTPVKDLPDTTGNNMPVANPDGAVAPK
jgi:hypothetical protein